MGDRGAEAGSSRCMRRRLCSDDESSDVSSARVIVTFGYAIRLCGERSGDVETADLESRCSFA